jgi:hypothetical protein
MHNTLRLLQPIPLLQLTALLQAIQLVDILQPLMAGRAMATAQDHPTSCAKLSERARLVTVAPTLSPMPNGKPLSSASGTAESASSAIAFRRTDYWLKPRRNARRARPALPRNHEARAHGRRRSTDRRCARADHRRRPASARLGPLSRTRQQVRRWSVGHRAPGKTACDKSRPVGSHRRVGALPKWSRSSRSRPSAGVVFSKGSVL